MTKIKKTANVKMNLTLPQEFSDLLEAKAKQRYMKTATFVKQFLMMQMLDANNECKKSINQNGTKMSN